MFQYEDRTTGIAGVPLSPEFLGRIGAMPKAPEAPAGFEPDGAWTHSYRIFTCHGHVDSGNEDVGWLKLARAPLPDGFFTLRISQRIVHTGGAVETLDAEVRCHKDAVGSLAEWKLESRIGGWDGEDLPELANKEQGRVAGGTVEIVRGGKTSRREAAGVLTSDFTLFEAVQRLPFQKARPLAFDLLEGLSIHRTSHRLSYDGPAGSRLHRFHQIGQGLGPYEYWLDNRHLLRLAASHARAYILDERAEEVVRRRIESERERAARRGKGGKKGGRK